MFVAKFAPLLFVLALSGKSESKVYTNCEVARALLANGIARDQLGTWVCIAQHESNFDTTAINYDTGDYGIFQISHYYWCSDSDTPGKECGITCQSLLQDDITEDITCIKLIFQETENEGRYGFTAWTTYNQFCASGDNWSYISDCGLLASNSTINAQ